MKKLLGVIKKYLKEILLIILGIITGAILFKKRKEEDILSRLGNTIDHIEYESGKKLEDVRRKLDLIKTIEDKEKRIDELLRLKEEVDEL